MICKILGYHSCAAAHSSLLWCYTMLAGKYWWVTVPLKLLLTIHHLTWHNIPEDLNLQAVTWSSVSSYQNTDCHCQFQYLHSPSHITSPLFSHIICYHIPLLLTIHLRNTTKVSFTFMIKVCLSPFCVNPLLHVTQQNTLTIWIASRI